MVYFFIVLALIIGFFIELFQYFRVKADAFSKKEVQDAAKAQAQKMRIIDPEINCDYCGCKVDTSKYKVCPHCGAPYDKDPEWMAKFDVKESFVSSGTDEIIAQREEKARIESQKILNRIKTTLIVLAVLLFGTVALAIVALIISHETGFREDEELNVSAYDNYVEIDCKIDNDGVLFDNGDVKFSISGIYIDEGRSSESDGYITNKVRIGFTLENNLNKNLNITCSSSSINGISRDAVYFIFYDDFRKKKTVTFYEDVSFCPGEGITEIIFDRISIRTGDYDYENIADISDGFTVRTDLGKMAEYDISAYEQIFTNDKVDVYTFYDGEEYTPGYKLFIYNKSDKAFTVTTSDFVIEGTTCNCYGFTDKYLPSGYLMATSTLHSYNDAFNDSAIRENKVKINLSFKCEEDPSLDFSTGYLVLK